VVGAGGDEPRQFIDEMPDVVTGAPDNPHGLSGGIVYVVGRPKRQ
jgi:hypothetical protein